MLRSILSATIWIVYFLWPNYKACQLVIVFLMKYAYTINGYRKHQQKAGYFASFPTGNNCPIIFNFGQFSIGERVYPDILE